MQSHVQNFWQLPPQPSIFAKVPLQGRHRTLIPKQRNWTSSKFVRWLLYSSLRLDWYLQMPRKKELNKETRSAKKLHRSFLGILHPIGHLVLIKVCPCRVNAQETHARESQASGSRAHNAFAQACFIQLFQGNWKLTFHVWSHRGMASLNNISSVH